MGGLLVQWSTHGTPRERGGGEAESKARAIAQYRTDWWSETCSTHAASCHHQPHRLARSAAVGRVSPGRCPSFCHLPLERALHS